VTQVQKGQEKVVGSIIAHQIGQTGFIIMFNIDPAQRGKGLGK
jgi:ribosomal protein S18 acetylase RimI-like enzyme